MNNELWCIYLAGPDDLVAMPSKAVAEAVARNFNAVWDRYGAERGHDVHAVAHAEPWMHGKDAHTKDLREHFHEYADLVLDEDAGQGAPAHAVEAVDETAFKRCVQALREMRIAFPDTDRDVYREATEALARADAALTHPRLTGCAVAELIEAARDVERRAGPDREPRLRAALAGLPPTVEQAGEVVGYANEDQLAYLRRQGQYKGADARVRDISIYSHQTHNTRVPLYAQPRLVGVPDGWLPIDEAPEGVELVVGWHEDGEFHNAFDAKSEGCWAGHAEHYDHFCAVAGAGMRGPKEQAPYTHWHPLAAAPEVPRG